MDVLQRLRDLPGGQHYRVTWQHGALDRVEGGKRIPGMPGHWKLWEVRPDNKHDQFRRAAGYARLQRFKKREGAKASRVTAGDIEYCYAMMHGLHFIGAWPEHAIVTRMMAKGRVQETVEQRFGSDAMFRELIEAERNARFAIAALDNQLRKEAAMDDASDVEAMDELDENPEFRAQARELYRTAAMEDYGLVFNGRHSVRFAETLKQEAGHGTDGESLEGSGQGVGPGNGEAPAAGGVG